MKLLAKRWLRLILIGLSIAVGLAAFSAWQILVYPSSPQGGGTRDCAIVLGAAVRGDKPSPVFEGRLEHALELFRQGGIRHLILTGGSGGEGEIPESVCG